MEVGNKNGLKVLKSIKKDVRVREEKMKQHNNKVIVRTLGIYMSHALS